MNSEDSEDQQVSKGICFPSIPSGIRFFLVKPWCTLALTVEIESLQLNLWSLGLVWFIVTFHDVPFQ